MARGTLPSPTTIRTRTFAAVTPLILSTTTSLWTLNAAIDSGVCVISVSIISTNSFF